MDANQTRFHLVFGRDWYAVRDAANLRAGGDPVVQLDDDGALRLQRWVPAIRTRAGDRPAALARRRGAARDRQGNSYVIDEDGIRLRCCPPPAAANPDGELFWSGARLRGLAITSDDLLVAGRGAEAPGEGSALLIFDLKAGGPPREVPTLFAPHDIAACGPDIWILALAPGRVFCMHIDCPTPPVPGPAPAADERLTPCEVPSAPQLRVQLDAGALLPAELTPVAVDVVAPADVLVLAQDVLLRLRDGAEIARFKLATLVREPGAPAPVGHELVVQGQRAVVVEAQGNQAFSFDARGDTLIHRAEFMPLYAYLGRDLVVGDGDIWYTSGRRWVPLVAMPRPLYPETASLRLPVAPATAHSPEQTSWDSGTPGCVWHRLLLDASIPAEVTVTVWSRAAETREALADPDAGWRREPPLHRRDAGSELPFAAPLARSATWELLLQRAVGRYLELRLDITGDRRVTPRIAAVRVYYPRFSYLEHYLPAAWRDDAVSADFVARFLANPEGIFTAIEDRVAAAHRLFDPGMVDAEFLPWLARWFDATLDPGWTPAQQRCFLRHATTLFAWRGTPGGILAALRLALSPAPDDSIFTDTPGGLQIVESFIKRPRVGRLPGALQSAGSRDPAVRWDSSFGRDSLVGRWNVDHAGPFPVSRPQDRDAASEWESFCVAQLRFVPAATGGDRERFRRFLDRRHGARMATVWPNIPAPAADAPLFTALPDDGLPLDDWYDFEALILPIARNAHRFTIVIPTPPHARLAADPGYPERLRALVRRIVEREKPAHTSFDIVFAEHHFRPGEVHLGYDTLLGDPEPGGAPPFILDRDVLGEAAVGAVFPARPPSNDGVFAGPTPLEPS